MLRLSSPHPSGGRVVERAAVLAAGTDAASILAWVVSHGHPEDLPEVVGRGLHGARVSAPLPSAPRNPLRSVLPDAALSALGA